MLQHHYKDKVTGCGRTILSVCSTINLCSFGEWLKRFLLTFIWSDSFFFYLAERGVFRIKRDYLCGFRGLLLDFGFLLHFLLAHMVYMCYIAEFIDGFGLDVKFLFGFINFRNFLCRVWLLLNEWCVYGSLKFWCCFVDD